MTPSTLSPMTNAVESEINQLNQRFKKVDPKKILAWCLTNIPTGLVQISAFNIDDLVITDLLYRQLRPKQPIPVIFLDTLHHFPETLQLVAKSREIYNLDLKIFKIAHVDSPETFAAKYGEGLWNQDLQKFHYLTKTEPQLQGLTKLNARAYITAYRRDLGESYPNLNVFQWDEHKRLQINPLAYWSRPESWAYAYEYDMIYNPLHDQGYSQIGDQPLTKKVVVEIQ